MAILTSVTLTPRRVYLYSGDMVGIAQIYHPPFSQILPPFSASVNDDITAVNFLNDPICTEVKVTQPEVSTADLWTSTHR